LITCAKEESVQGTPLSFTHVSLVPPAGDKKSVRGVTAVCKLLRTRKEA
jgi:hypothetical protein